MKKLILIPLAIVFIGNITGQSNHDGFSPCTCPSCNHSNKQTATLKGTIKDEVTGDPISFAWIKIIDESQKGTVVMSDEDGFYFLENILPGTYQMQISSIGYKTIQHNTVIPSGSVIMNNILMEGGRVISCGFIVRTNEKTTDDPIKPTTEETSQGPITGLEGHNFIEDPAIIYPNPVKDIMNIKSTDPITVIEILSLTGQVEMVMDPRSTLDVSGLAAGTYYVRMHFENIKDVQVEKILVVK